MQPIENWVVYDKNEINQSTMKQIKITFLLIVLGLAHTLQAQQTDDYIEFNDRKNVVHGVYLGISPHYGEINDKSTFLLNLKVAYVANQQFEVGFQVTGFYSEQDLVGLLSTNEDLVGGYAGLHLEPILFSKSTVNLSFPVFIGGGAAGYIDGNLTEDEADIDDSGWDEFFVVEPGVNLLFNISRYLQIETGVKYRYSSKIELIPSSVTRLDGFSAGLGIKVGIFNMGRNRYKKQL